MCRPPASSFFLISIYATNKRLCLRQLPLKCSRLLFCICGPFSSERQVTHNIMEISARIAADQSPFPGPRHRTTNPRLPRPRLPMASPNQHRRAHSHPKRHHPGGLPAAAPDQPGLRGRVRHARAAQSSTLLLPDTIRARASPPHARGRGPQQQVAVWALRPREGGGGLGGHRPPGACLGQACVGARAGCLRAGELFL